MINLCSPRDATFSGDKERLVGRVGAYRNIRYARAERFATAELLPYEGHSRANERGPIPLQNPSRYEPVLGKMENLQQTEDCQVLSVFTPGLVGKRPVMIWFHGGAFLSGGGELPWYDGELLAGEQDVVVVCVTARLGVFGYLHLAQSGEEVQGPSPGTTDQLTAIEWVHKNIAEFGGDPNNITLFGQSAGGFAIEVMLRWGLGQHVKGAIIQSGFIKEAGLVYKRQDAVAQAYAFRKLVGQSPHAMTGHDLLKAQTLLGVEAGKPMIWAPIRPETETALHIPVIAGMTRHDTLPYILMERGIANPKPEHLEIFAAEVRERNNREIAIENCVALDEVRRSGQRAWLYEFLWTPSDSGWGASHCIELPFLLGGYHGWSQAPLFKDADWNVLARRGEYMRAIWAAFARHQEPGFGWSEYNKTIQSTNLLSD